MLLGKINCLLYKYRYNTLSATWIPTAVIFFWLLRPAKLKPLVLQMLPSSMIPLSGVRLQINQDIDIFCPQNAITRWSWAQTKANILGANQRQKTICSGHWYTPNLGPTVYGSTQYQDITLQWKSGDQRTRLLLCVQIEDLHKMTWLSFCCCLVANVPTGQSKRYVYIYILLYNMRYTYIYIYGYWVKSVPHGTAFINCTCMFEGYINLPSTHIYQRHS